AELAVAGLAHLDAAPEGQRQEEEGEDAVPEVVTGGEAGEERFGPVHPADLPRPRAIGSAVIGQAPARRSDRANARFGAAIGGGEVMLAVDGLFQFVLECLG